MNIRLVSGLISLIFFTALLGMRAEQKAQEKPLVRKEGEHVALELKEKSWKILKDAKAYLKKLDQVYEAYAGLVGGSPYGGEKICIREVDEYPGGWAVAGRPIKWHSRYVAESLKKVNGGDNLFGILHEIGHNFDDIGKQEGDGYKWVWHAEFFANFKMVYVLEQTKLRADIGGVYDYADPKGKRLEEYYRGTALKDGEEDEKPLKDWFVHSDPATQKFLMVKNEIGWEPFKKTFRDFNKMAKVKVPESAEAKLALFVHLLCQHSGKDMWKRFEKWGFPMLRPVDCPQNLPAEKFATLFSTEVALLNTLQLLPVKPAQVGQKALLEIAVSPRRQCEYGLRTHANSHIVYSLGGKYKTLEAVAYPCGGGTVNFKVKLDDKEVWESGDVNKGERPDALPVHVDVSTAHTLELIVAAGPNGINCCSADWVEACLIDGGDRKTYLDDLKPKSAKQDWGQLQTKHDRKGQKLSLRDRHFPEGEMTVKATVEGRTMTLSKSDESGIYQAEVMPSKEGKHSVLLEASYGKSSFRRLYVDVLEVVQ